MKNRAVYIPIHYRVHKKNKTKISDLSEEKLDQMLAKKNKKE